MKARSKSEAKRLIIQGKADTRDRLARCIEGARVTGPHDQVWANARHIADAVLAELRWDDASTVIVEGEEVSEGIWDHTIIYQGPRQDVGTFKLILADKRIRFDGMGDGPA